MKILLFCPFVLVDEFSTPFLIINKIFKKLNIKTVFIFCEKAMTDSCLGMLALTKKESLTENEKNNFCLNCQKKSQHLKKIISDPIYWLKQSNTQKNNFNAGEIKQLKKHCLYELLLRSKTSSIPKNKEFKTNLRTKYEVNKSVYLQCKNIFETEKPDILFLLNSMYSIHHSLTVLAKNYKIKVISFQRSLAANNQHHVFTLGHHIQWLWDLSKKIKKISITKQKIDTCRNHISSLCMGKRAWDYSIHPNLSKNTEKIKESYILVLLSSSDEIFSAIQSGFFESKIVRNHIFNSQTEFIIEISKIAKVFSQEKFLIRTHPRMFANKRDFNLSSEGRFLEKKIRPKLLKDAEKHSNIIWPTHENLGSLWDLLHSTKLVLNAWSSAAEVFAFHSIPVVSAFPCFENSQQNLHYFAKSKKQYYKLIKQILNNPERFNRSLLAAKWIFASTQFNSAPIQPFSSRVEKVFEKKFPVFVFQVKVFFLQKLEKIKHYKVLSFFRNLIASKLHLY